jgi:hypothetical protein
MSDVGAFREGYRRYVADAAGADFVAQAGSSYVDKVQESIDKLVAKIIEASDSNLGVDQAKGFAAEQWHAGTANVDATVKGLPGEVRAPTDSGPQDIVSGSDRADPAQVKYYGSGKDTAEAISAEKYHGQQKVVPSDQRDEVRSTAERVLDNPDVPPEVARSYADTAQNASDTYRTGGAESRPLSEPDSRELVRDARDDGKLDREKLGLTTQEAISLDDIVRQSLEAGSQAAALSVAVALAPAILRVLQSLEREGKLTRDDLERLVTSSRDAAVRSGASGTITAALVVASKSGHLGEFASEIPPDVIAFAVVFAVQSMQITYRAATGKISWDQAGLEIAKGAVVLAGAFAGAQLGQLLIPVPILGGLIGSLIGGAIARWLVGLASGQNGLEIEQNYEIPSEILVLLGCEVVELEEVEWDEVSLEPVDQDIVELEPIMVDGVELKVLGRAFVGEGKVGYVIL